MITSSSNPKVKFVRRLQTDRRFRSREKLLVVEGARWMQELLTHQAAPAQIFFTAAWQAANAAILQQLAQISHQPPQPVSEAVMAAMSDTETAPGVLAVLPLPELAWPAHPTLLLILDGIGTPGNLGTILRTAGAAGVEGVLLSPGCVDPANPKVVRGSMGALLRLPVRQLDWAGIAAQVADLTVWVAMVEGETAYTAVDWRQPSALIIGSEAAGAGQEAQQVARRRITIPMHGRTESLNAAIAAGVILFEAKRQRDNSG